MIRPEMKKFYNWKWKEISKGLIKQVGHCVNCGNGKKLLNPLTVHHIDFDPENNLSSNLEVLCARCHLRLHARIQKYGRNNKKQLELFCESSK